MIKYQTDSKKGNLLLPHGLLFPINTKGSFICTIPQTGLHIPQPLLHQSWSTGWNEILLLFTVYFLFSFITIIHNSCVSCTAICSHGYVGYLYPPKDDQIKVFFLNLLSVIMVILKL